MTVDYGTFVSRTLQANPGNFDLVLFKKSSPVSTADINLTQDIYQQDLAAAIAQTKSGVLVKKFGESIPFADGTVNSQFPSMSDQPHHMLVQGFTAKVKDWFFDVRGSSVNGATIFDENFNILALGPPDAPVYTGTGARFDLVFLEVWRAVVETGVLTNKPAVDKIYPLGNVQWGQSASYLDDDLVDPLIGVTHSARVQVQYRWRIVPGVSIPSVTDPDPMLDPIVLAQGATAAPVAGKTFTRDTEDSGLYVAGAGDAADRLALGTPDGQVCAIPMFVISRRNNNAFSVSANKSGSAISIASGDASDRPDGLYYDQIATGDFFSHLFHRVSVGMIDFTTLAEDEFLRIQDGRHQTLGCLAGCGAAGSSDLMQFDGISPIPPGQAGIDDIGQPDNIRRYFTDSMIHQRTVGEVTEGAATTGTTVEFYTTFPVTGNPDLPDGQSDIIAIRADQSLLPNATIGLGSFGVRIGEPLLNWRTSKINVALTQAGASTTELTLDRLMMTKDGLEYDELARDAGEDTGTLTVTDWFSQLSGDPFMVIGSKEPFNALQITMTEELNEVIGNIEADYLDSAGTWCPLAINAANDTTKNPPVTGPSLAQTGDISWDAPGNQVPMVLNGGPELYYVRLKRVASPGFTTNTTIQKIVPAWKSLTWKGFGTDLIWAQVDTGDTDYAAGDIIDAMFDIVWPGSAGLSFIPDPKKSWRIAETRAPFGATVIPGTFRHDMTIIDVNDESRTFDLDVPPTNISAVDYFWFGVDYNPLHSNFEVVGQSIRHVVGFVEGDGGDTYSLPGTIPATAFGSDVTGTAYITNYFKFEEETAPGVWTPLVVGTPPALIRNNSVSFTVTFTGPVVAGRAIRFWADVDVDGFVFAKDQKGIVESVSVEQVADTTTADGIETTFEFVFSGEILSYEADFISGGPNNPVAWVDAVPPSGSFTREIVAVSIENKKILEVTFGVPPASGSEIRISAVVAKPLPNAARTTEGVLSPVAGSTHSPVATENYQIGYAHQPYQGIQTDLPLPTKVEVLAVTKNEFVHTIGTGASATDAQRDPRLTNLSTRLPLADAFEDGAFRLDALKFVDSLNAAPYKIAQMNPIVGPDLREGDFIQIVDESMGATNARRGISDHSLLVENNFGLTDYVVEVNSQRVEPVTRASDTWNLVHAALVRDVETYELFMLVINATIEWNQRTGRFTATYSDLNVAFDLFKTRESWLV